MPSIKKKPVKAKKSKRVKAPLLPVAAEELLLTPAWCKSPAWRWDIITSFVADPYKALKSVKEDDILINGAIFYRDRYISNKRPSVYRQKHPEFCYAVDMYMSSHNEGLRWVIEALMMTEASNEEIQDILNINIPVESIRIYRKLFFDVDEYRDSEVAMLTNILSISKIRDNVEISSDHAWKWFAYTWGANAFTKNLLSKKPNLDTKYLKWYKGLIRDNMFKNAVVMSKDVKSLYEESTLEVLRTAKDYMNIDEEVIQGASNSGVSGFLSDLHKNVDMVLMSSDIKTGAIEQRKGYDYSALIADMEKIDKQG